jgi:hypothetical protein
MKVNTVEQYHVIEFIKQHFDMDSITVSEVNRNTLKVIDQTGEEMNFYYVNGEVRWT